MKNFGNFKMERGTKQEEASIEGQLNRQRRSLDSR
jgi:hypothetical protein